MNCPGCNAKVAEGSSICPVCDYIIDSTFLSAEPPEADDDEATGAVEDPRAKAGPRARPPAGKSGPRAAVADADATNVKSVEQIARERQQRPSRPASRPSAARSSPAVAKRPAPEPEPEARPSAVDAGPDPWSRAERSSNGSPIEDPEVLMEDARDFLRLLQGSDRIAFWGAVVVVLSCFLPWKETAADGDVLGLMSMGAGAFLLAVGAMVAIGVRVRRSLPGLNPMLPWLGQLAMTLVCLVWCAIYMKAASDTTRVPTPIGNADMMNSSPSIGVFLAVLGALAALGGTLMGLKDKPAA